MNERYPMTNLEVAATSIMSASADHKALRITDEEFEMVKRGYFRRVMQIKKQALFVSAAAISRRELPSPKKEPPPKGRP